MKVDFSANLNIYKATAGALSKVRKNEEPKEKTDIAEFSRGQTAVRDKSFVSLKSAIQRDLSAPADTKRIDELRQQVKNGTYRVSTRDLVRSLLEA